jgi:hypothetical protein
MALDDLSIAQSSLARAIARARAGEDHELAQKVRERGETIAKLLAGLLRLNRLHDAQNAAFEVPVAELSRAVGDLYDLLGTVHLVAVKDQVYVNDVRVPASAPGIKELTGELATHNAGGLTFHGPLAPDAVRSLVACFSAKPTAVAPRRALQQALLARGILAVELTPRVRFVGDDGDAADVRDPVEAMRRTLRLVEETYDNVFAGRVLNVLPLRRAVAAILDVGPGTPELWETIPEGLPHASHAASVALVALLVGKAAGLRSGVLQDVGLAGLTHDMGYAALPPDAPPADSLPRHGAETARIMLRQRGFHVAKLRRLRAVLDHHRDFADPRGAPSALGALLRLAEDYSTLLRLHGAKISPADALGAIARGAGRVYHPALAQLMVNVLGRYPPGTLLELEDGRLARSVSPVRTAETFATPLVRLFDAKTRAFSAERLDLARGGAPAVRRVLPG